MAYKWAIGIDGALHESEIEVRADNASSQGVPYPKEWKNRLGMRAGVPAVDEFAATAVKRARVELALGEDVKLDCRHASLRMRCV